MRPASFLLHIPKSTDLSLVRHPVSACKGLFPYSGEYSAHEAGKIWVGWNGKSTVSDFQYSNEDTLLWLFNEESDGLAQNVLSLISKFGLSSLSNLQSDGVVVVIKDNILRLFNGALSVTPLYYAVDDRHILIATEAKALTKQDLIPIRLAGLENFQLLPYFKGSGHCLLETVSKLDSGCSIEIDLQTKSLNVHEGHFWSEEFTADRLLEDEVAALYHILNNKVEKCMNGQSIGIPLSGGFDSGAVAAMSAQYADVHTFTMGTENVNEFDNARIMADFISSDHQEIIIKEEELIPAILHGIFLNELADPVYAEGYSGLYFVFREAGKKVSTLITGYGADLTLSNFLGGPLSAVHEVAEQLIKRTSWTGELTKYAPQHFELNVKQPFLDVDVIDRIQSIPVDLKVRQGVEKFIEKEMIIRYGLMPQQLLDLKKKALHTGAGIDRLFNQALGIKEDQGYIIKSNFLYHAWKEIIFEGKSPSNVDVDKLVYNSKIKK